MNLREIEERVVTARDAEEPEFLFELLRAYGIPKASITRLRSGSYNRTEEEGEYLWKEKVYYRSLDCPDEELYAVVDAVKAEERVLRERPRFAIARNSQRLVAADLKTGGALDIEIKELQNHAAFFLPWAGIEKTQIANQNLADVKAAEKMAKLYDEIVKRNAVETEEQIHELNVFFSQLLFCFFAEDTGVFEKGSFTNAIGSLSHRDGKDLHELLDRIFDVLNTEPDSRIGYPSHLLKFGYVNGKLFERHSSAPRFTAKARSLVLDCGTLDWSQINPDIFGSMIQAVVHPSHRGKLGMHYTSVDNIMKVLRPLFLDELEAEFETAEESVAKLDRLLDRLAAIQVFDPACGSGNFLVIAYKELRRLEHKILERTSELEPSRSKLFEFSRIHLDNFYGIEIDDFAHEIATLSLWLAKHQMNIKFKELFGVDIPLIPLKEAGKIVCGNAAQLDWNTVCSPGSELYVCGNPPYQGARLQSRQQKADLLSVAGGIPHASNLDYVAIWLLKGAEYVAQSNASLAFVATNSVTQGEQVAILWPALFRHGVTIKFAVLPFRWTNLARGGAGVTCVIVGLAPGIARTSLIFDGDSKRTVKGITPYLTAGDPQLVVKRLGEQLVGLPAMSFGNMPNDGGALILTAYERQEMIDAAPEAEKYLRRFLGSREFLNGIERYCLWIEADEVKRALAIREVAERVERVRSHRLASRRSATRTLAQNPHRFGECRHEGGNAILVPRHSSERRRYVPFGFVGDQTIIADSAIAIYGAELWLFGLLHSTMHMVWLKAVGGRLKSDYRYSTALVYNTFCVPRLTTKDKEMLKAGAIGVLAAREQFPELTLAELYDPDKMPPGLLDAHRTLDRTVDRLYRSRPFESDEERLKVLFDMYEATVAEQEAVNA